VDVGGHKSFRLRDDLSGLHDSALLHDWRCRCTDMLGDGYRHLGRYRKDNYRLVGRQLVLRRMDAALRECLEHVSGNLSGYSFITTFLQSQRLSVHCSFSRFGWLLFLHREPYLQDGAGRTLRRTFATELAL